MVTLQLPTHLTPPNTISEGPCDKYAQFMDSSREERTFMIEKLVETYAKVIDSIWKPKQEHNTKVVPMRVFINEILKRSKATYSTVQISLFYIFRIKNVVLNQLNKPEKDVTCCGRRMFLASLMLASKYLHDKSHQNKAWANITGLCLNEINRAEMAFLSLIDYRLYVPKPTFDTWYTKLHDHIITGYRSDSGICMNGKRHLDDNDTFVNKRICK